MENSEKIEIIQYHNNLLGFDCPCVLRATGKFEIHDPSRMPKDDAELEEWRVEMVADMEAKEYKTLRRAAYEDAGLSFDRWTELTIENDTAGKEAFKATRDAIKLQYPKP